MNKLLVSFLFIFWSLSVHTQPAADFYDRLDQLLESHVKDGHVDYMGLQNSLDFEELLGIVEQTDLNGMAGNAQKAFAINAYNLTVIRSVLNIYPTTSVQKSFGFFDQAKRRIAGMDITLNDFEKQYLLDLSQDPRLHFVLVCAAVSCPPIIDRAYRPEILDEQLETQSSQALNDPEFIQIINNERVVKISQIFKWYASDFGGSLNAIVKYINEYREEKIPEDFEVSYYGYNWQLNDLGNVAVATNAARYVVSAAIPAGTSELKIFNNLYSQRTGSNNELVDRSTFFTTSVSAIYGFTNRFNAGVEIRYRRVLNNQLPSSPLDVFQGGQSESSFRQGITAIGPRVRFAPIPKWQNFSIQSTLSFPIGDDLSGNGEKPYIDWSGISFLTQFFNDKALGNHFSLFTELDLFIEDIGPTGDNHANRFSTPVTVILSYFPNPKTTLYALSGYSPYWQSTFDYFLQGGLGAKYQFTPNFELELLYTGFTNKFLNGSGGKAATYNIGIRSNF